MKITNKQEFNTMIYNYIDRYFFAPTAEANRKNELELLKAGKQPPSAVAIKQLLAFSVKAKRCFITENDDFEGKSDEEIKSFCQTQIDESMKKNNLLIAKLPSGMEFPICEDIKEMQKQFICCDTCLSIMSISYKQKLSTILVQVNRIHRKLGFCPVRLEFTSEEFTESHVTDKLVEEFLKGGAKNNKPFRSIGTLLYNQFCVENNAKFVKCVAFSPKVRAFTNFDQVFGLNVKDLPKDISETREEKYFNNEFTVKQWKSQRDEMKTFTQARDLILYMLQTIIEFPITKIKTIKFSPPSLPGTIQHQNYRQAKLSRDLQLIQTTDGLATRFRRCKIHC